MRKGGAFSFSVLGWCENPPSARFVHNCFGISSVIIQESSGGCLPSLTPRTPGPWDCGIISEPAALSLANQSAAGLRARRRKYGGNENGVERKFDGQNGSGTPRAQNSFGGTRIPAQIYGRQDSAL